MKKEIVNWNIPVNRKLDQAVEEAVKKDMHSTKSDFIRDAARRLLEKSSNETKPNTINKEIRDSGDSNPLLTE